MYSVPPIPIIKRSVTITLTWPELAIAALIGTSRQIQNLTEGRKDRYGIGLDNAWSVHIEGAAGEMAVAKYIKGYWSGALGDLQAGDVGNVQVRTSPANNARLILHKADKDDQVFVLVKGRAPTYELCGYIKAADGKRDEYWVDPTGNNRFAYFVPDISLRPMSDLV